MKMRLLILLLDLLALLPLRGLHRLGWLIGRLFILIPNRERRNAEINLRLCFPEMSTQDRRLLLERCLEEAARTLTEMAGIWCWPIERVLGQIQSIQGTEHLERPSGQGLIVLSPHLGCWEIAGLYLAKRGSVTSLYRPPRKAIFEPIFKRARERSGAVLVPTDTRGIKRLFKVLQGGGTIGMLPDQQPDSNKGAVFAPFFGVPALTMLLVNRLVRKTDAKVVFCYAERLSKGRGFEIHFLPAAQAVGAADPVAAASALNQGVETCVRRCPQQYQWTYKRFKEQPAGQLSPYRIEP
jgi:KDO2-lipid IV(A) lauroyltransferase